MRSLRLFDIVSVASSSSLPVFDPLSSHHIVSPLSFAKNFSQCKAKILPVFTGNPLGALCFLCESWYPYFFRGDYSFDGAVVRLRNWRMLWYWHCTGDLVGGRIILLFSLICGQNMFSQNGCGHGAGWFHCRGQHLVLRDLSRCASLPCLRQCGSHETACAQHAL